jgi:hypothetical protein
MQPQGGLVRVRLAALLTHVWPVAGVRPEMDHQRSAKPERPRARDTLERSLVGVDTGVLQQLDALRVGLAARAHERPLAGVGPRVRLQIAARRERFATHVARMLRAPGGVRLLLVDPSAMQAQLAGRVEPLLALATRVRVGGLVHGQVIVQVGLADERTTAQFAQERLVRGMHRQVPSQIADECETTTTRVAGVRPFAGVGPLVKYKTLLLAETPTAELANEGRLLFAVGVPRFGGTFGAVLRRRRACAVGRFALGFGLDSLHRSPFGAATSAAYGLGLHRAFVGIFDFMRRLNDGWCRQPYAARSRQSDVDRRR